MKEPKVYRLYAARPDQKNVEEAGENRFHRVTPLYILLYTEKNPGEQWVEVAGKELGRLTKRDEKWLWDCVAALLADILEERKQESGRRMEELIDNLEKELQKAAHQREED